MSYVQLKELSKRFVGATTDAVSGINLEVSESERFVIVGPSGSGKSTVLRMIAGLEAPTIGEIRIGGTRMNAMPPRHRGVAMVFQHQVLYPHLNVFENMAFGLRARRVPIKELTERTNLAADWLGLGALLHRKPKSLSGGERQRISIGRAFVTRPAVLLLDEPFSGLDARLRASTRDALFDLHRHIGGTLILVTHDQSEALAFGDRVALMRAGKFEQVGTPGELYNRPVNSIVAGFVGDPPMSLLPCGIIDGKTVIESHPENIVLKNVAIPLGLSKVWLGFRPESTAVNSIHHEDSSSIRLTASIERIELRGFDSIARLRVGSHSIQARLSADSNRNMGESVTITVDVDRVTWFPRPSEIESS